MTYHSLEQKTCQKPERGKIQTDDFADLKWTPSIIPGTHAAQIQQTAADVFCQIDQRHIDQAQSMNLYITNDYTLRQVLNLYILAWECGVKTLYYVRSKSLEVEECESCSA